LSAWDLLAGLRATIALLASERAQAATGQGQLVELSLTDVAAAPIGHLGFVPTWSSTATPGRLVRQPAPALGADAPSVLAEWLGATPAEIATLRRAGIIDWDELQASQPT
jgi:crotonobetainyl-CoA:carnitine CoA-transferase CaiB-like acyl-CoA transferase